MPTPPIWRVARAARGPSSRSPSSSPRATLAPGATARDGIATDRSGKIVPPRKGTWVGTSKEQSGSQQAKMKRVVDVEKLLGRQVDIDHVDTRRLEGQLPRLEGEVGRRVRRVPFVSWAKASTSAINSGRYDGMIKQRAKDVKAADLPILLEWFWAMDGNRNRHIADPPASFITASPGSGARTPGASTPASAEVLPRRRVCRLDLCQRVQLGPGPRGRRLAPVRVGVRRLLRRGRQAGQAAHDRRIRRAGTHAGREGAVAAGRPPERSTRRSPRSRPSCTST